MNTNREKLAAAGALPGVRPGCVVSVPPERFVRDVAAAALSTAIPAGSA